MILSNSSQLLLMDWNLRVVSSPAQLAPLNLQQVPPLNLLQLLMVELFSLPRQLA